MLSHVEKLVARIHESPLLVVIAAAGGGATAIAELTAAPGASRTLLEGAVPYSAASLADWLGGPPDQACSPEAARAMAMAAFLRARRLNRSESPIAGVACTASLATDRPKRGEHRIHLAAQTEAHTASWSLQLEKGRRGRPAEERLAASMLLNMLAGMCGVEGEIPLELCEGERVEHSEATAPAAWQDLLMERVDAIRHGGPEDRPQRWPPAVFPGAFNPLHVGHRRMAAIAQKLLGVAVEFEISILNVDKPPLDYLELRRRTGQFDAAQTVWLTRLATFEAKSRRFPGATFVVGADTLRRIAEPRYYGGDARACRAALESIAERGCRFLVFARSEKGEVVTVADLDLPAPLPAICRQVPPEQFLEDISSTKLRSSGKW